jgi:hypothetical protein
MTSTGLAEMSIGAQALNQALPILNRFLERYPSSATAALIGQFISAVPATGPGPEHVSLIRSVAETLVGELKPQGEKKGRPSGEPGKTLGKRLGQLREERHLVNLAERNFNRLWVLKYLGDIGAHEDVSHLSEAEPGAALIVLTSLFRELGETADLFGARVVRREDLNSSDVLSSGNVFERFGALLQLCDDVNEWYASGRWGREMERQQLEEEDDQLYKRAWTAKDDLLEVFTSDKLKRVPTIREALQEGLQKALASPPAVKEELARQYLREVNRGSKWEPRIKLSDGRIKRVVGAALLKSNPPPPAPLEHLCGSLESWTGRLLVATSHIGANDDKPEKQAVQRFQEFVKQYRTFLDSFVLISQGCVRIRKYPDDRIAMIGCWLGIQASLNIQSSEQLERTA